MKKSNSSFVVAVSTLLCFTGGSFARDGETGGPELLIECYATLRSNACHYCGGSYSIAVPCGNGYCSDLVVDNDDATTAVYTGHNAGLKGAHYAGACSDCRIVFYACINNLCGPTGETFDDYWENYVAFGEACPGGSLEVDP